MQHALDANEKPVTISQNPPRQSYPPELLKHRFMPYGSLAPSSPVKEDKEAEQRHETKSEKKVDITEALQINETLEAMPSISMEVDSAPKSEKKDKKEGKDKRRAKVTELSQDIVSGSSTTETKKTAKKRKGAEAGEEAVEGKKHKKLKTKAV